MRLGDRHYDLVRSQSGFSVTLAPSHPAQGPQAWHLELRYVPAENNPRPRPLWELEHLEISFNSFRYQTDDWRELSGFGPTPALDTMLFNITLANLLERGSSPERHLVCPEAITVQPAGGYDFRCQFEGWVQRGEEEFDLVLDETISFTQARVAVAANCANPEAAARAIARRDLKLTEFAGSHFTINANRELKIFFKSLDRDNRVTLYTPWREALA